MSFGPEERRGDRGMKAKATAVDEHAKPWFFDLWARFYDARWVQRVTYRPVHDAVLEELRGTRPRRILDLACGTGLLSQRLAQTFAGARIVGCDFSAQMLRRAARRSLPLECVQGDVAHLPFRDRSFDTIVSTEAFHWFPNQPAALDEMRRLLRRDGRLLLALVNPTSATLSSATHLGSSLAGEPFYWPTRDQMRRLLVDAGFHVRKQRRVYRLPGGLLFPPVLTIAQAVR